MHIELRSHGSRDPSKDELFILPMLNTMRHTPALLWLNFSLILYLRRYMTTRFDVGDRAVYPAQGVAEVVRIETKEIMGTSQTFYVLSVMDSDKKIMIPVNNVDNVGLRSIISKKEVEEVYDILRERDVDLNQQTWNRRYRAYVEKIQTGSPFEIAEVMRDLNLLKFHKTLSFGERKMLDTARRLLIQEIAVAKDSTEEEILEELEHIFTA
jgi:CarD family transcriptional regulator